MLEGSLEVSFTIGRPIVKLISRIPSSILLSSLNPYFNVNCSLTAYSLTRYLPNLGAAASQRGEGINRGLKCFTNYQLNLDDAIIELKRWISILCKELIKSEYTSEMSLPRIITLDLFQHYFTQINGVVTHYALERIFNSMRGARASTNEEKQEWADREWKQDDCDCEDPYRYGLPCRHMLIRCLMQRLPISPALIHPRWCVATKLIAAPDWQPRYIEDMAFQGDPLPGHPEALTRIRLSVLRLLDIIKDLPAEEMGELANRFEDFEVA